MVKILGHEVAVPVVVPLAVEAAVADQWAAAVVAPDPCLTRIIGKFENRFKFLLKFQYIHPRNSLHLRSHSDLSRHGGVNISVTK